MLDMSPWPIISSILTLSMMSSITMMMNKMQMEVYFLIMIIIIMSSITWWRDVSRESFMQGWHLLSSMKNLKIGMILFITSEVLFFSSFFWSFFHSSISPTFELGQQWPPMMIEPFNPMNVPLLNTIILVSSGASITWSHHLIINNNKTLAKNMLILTIILGIYFTILQSMEYSISEYSLSDSCYGSTFFMATGFHGLHVIIGSTFLMVCAKRLSSNFMSFNHITGFETAAWYWHFVDVVWLFLYTTIYWWGA
uniref:Cytochrome c oxidase subunit 3 n=1 Tax=Spinibdella lignicola TaxID=2872682 RepID=A0A977S4V6_9ACAR|nr:cytochrome c oxidase subunit III [Spinibdella lignicola]UXN44118.1 cytochrome c oxidase subunit III [Spinibdella lignicola]